MAAQNLWGQIPSTGTIRTPVGILREQAGLLGQATNNVLEGHVSISKDRGYYYVGAEARQFEFRLTLFIIAPALDNYRFAVLHVLHDIQIYPLFVTSLADDTEYQCADEAAFLNAIKEILSSEEIHRIIQALLSQSQAA